MATISNMMWVEEGELTPTQTRQAKEALTLYPKPSPVDPEPPQKILQYREDGGRFGVPFAWGEVHLSKLKAVDDLSLGKPITVPRLPDPNSPKAPPNQKDFFDDVVAAVQAYTTVLAVAPTGSGKTVSLLNAIGTLGRTALVIVPSAYLASQWKEEAMLHLGLEWRDIGILQGASEDWKGKKIVVAVIHNLFLKEWPEAFYSTFGFVAWDEAHTLGARVFSSTMFLFNARYRVAVSATPDRKDGCDALYKNYFGPPAVVAKAKALACECYVVPFNHVGDKHKWVNKCKVDVKPMQWLSKLKMRNEMIVRLACNLYDDGRTILLITKYVEHVELLIEMLVAQGVPRAEVGQFTRSTSTNKKHGQAFLDKLKKESLILVGTYSMIKMGVDIPRLDTGIEALPSADNVQAIGRIRRPFLNKKKPKWFTVSDLRIPLFEAYTDSRLRGFRNSNVTVKYLDKGVI